MSMKWYWTFLKAQILLDIHRQIDECHIKDIRWVAVYYISLDMQSGYFTAQADWGATIQGQNGPGTMAVKEYSALPKAPILLETHYLVVECHIKDIHWLGCTTPCRHIVGVFDNPPSQPTVLCRSRADFNSYNCSVFINQN